MRLTQRMNDGCDTICENCPMRGKCSDSQDCVDVLAERLATYEDAEEHGRLVILPVKAGDTVYQLRDKKHALGVGVHPRHINCVWVYGNDWIAMHQGDKPCAKKDLGKTWFLTREEAKAALKGEEET